METRGEVGVAWEFWKRNGNPLAPVTEWPINNPRTVPLDVDGDPTYVSGPGCATRLGEFHFGSCEGGALPVIMSITGPRNPILRNPSGVRGKIKSES